jgi:hypothetical protein
VDIPPRGMRPPTWPGRDVDDRRQGPPRQGIAAVVCGLCLYAAAAAGVAILVANLVAKAAVAFTNPVFGGTVTYIAIVVSIVVTAGLMASRVLSWLFGRICSGTRS